jgi:UDPglucose--hexose-1-phosphate uridylyltransferase
MWLVPDHHEPDWLECDAGALAESIRAAIRALRRRWPEAAFNLTLSSAPPRMQARASFHWHMELLPRLTTVAGFELSTGSWMNIVDAEKAASELREPSAGPSK